MPTYTDKYQSQNTVFGNKYTFRGTLVSDKYEPKWGFLLQESLSFLLLEDGGKIIRQEQLDYSNKYV